MILLLIFMIIVEEGKINNKMKELYDKVVQMF
jgi:hypothetical protein